MGLSREEVRHIAQLSRLQLSNQEEEKYSEQLSAILEYVAKLRELDTQNIPPTASVSDQSSRLREDEELPSLSSADLMANAPDQQDEQFRVPPVLE